MQHRSSLDLPVLEGVPETLLIPLAARANADTLCPDLKFVDQHAKTLYRQLEHRAKRFLVDTSTMRGAIVRAQWIDNVVRQFLTGNPNGLCVSMGSGLDCRHERIPLANFVHAHWVDIDFDHVIEMRKALLPDTERVQTLSADLTEVAWLDEIGWSDGCPTIFFGEGVLIYLQEQSALNLIRAIFGSAEKRHTDIELVFDFCSPLMVKQSRRHPSLAKTDASFHWPLPRLKDLQQIDDKLHCLEVGDVMSRSGIGSAIFCALYRAMTLGRWFYGCARFERKL